MIQETVKTIRGIVNPYTAKFKKNVSIAIKNNLINVDFDLVKYYAKDKVLDRSDESESAKYAEELLAEIVQTIPNENTEISNKGNRLSLALIAK